MTPATPSHALQPTRLSRSGCNPRVSWAGSLSLGYYRLGQPEISTVFSDSLTKDPFSVSETNRKSNDIRETSAF